MAIRLTTGEFYPVATFFQFVFEGLALIALDFNVRGLDRASDSAFLLQFSGQCLELRLRQGQSGDDRDCFTRAPFGLSQQAHDTVTCSRRAVPAADAIGHRAVALRAQAPQGGGIDGSAVVAWPGHGCTVSLRVNERYIIR